MIATPDIGDNSEGNVDGGSQLLTDIGAIQKILHHRQELTPGDGSNLCRSLPKDQGQDFSHPCPDAQHSCTYKLLFLYAIKSFQHNNHLRDQKLFCEFLTGSNKKVSSLGFPRLKIHYFCNYQPV